MWLRCQTDQWEVGKGEKGGVGNPLPLGGGVESQVTFVEIGKSSITATL